MKITNRGGAGMIGGVRSPMASPSHGMVGKSKMRPAIASNTMRGDIATGAARVRSAQTAGKVVKPF